MKIYVTLASFAANKKAMSLLSSISSEIVVRAEKYRPVKSELISLVANYDVLIIGVKEKMDYDVYKKSVRLKYLCTLSIGIDHIDKAFFDSGTIKVIACTNSNVHTVAEFVFAYLLCNMKSFNECNQAFLDKTGRDGIKNTPSELSSKTIGVIGAGRIATKFFEISNNFLFKKLCWTFHPEKHDKLTLNYGVEFVSLQNLFEVSDYIIVLIPYSDKTERLIMSSLLKFAKLTAKIINVSRMNILDITAFFSEVKDGKFEGSLFDCFPEEITDEQMDQVKSKISFSPHIAGISVESRERMSREIAEKLISTAGIIH